MQGFDKIVTLTFKTKLRKSQLKSTKFKVPISEVWIFEFRKLNYKVQRFEFETTITVPTSLSWTSGIVYYCIGGLQSNLSKVLLLGLLRYLYVRNFGGYIALPHHLSNNRFN